MDVPSPLPERDPNRPGALNRRREGYELTKQRNMVPIIMGSIIGTVICHAIAYIYFPVLLGREMAPDPGKTYKEDVVRVIARRPPEEIPKEAELQKLNEEIAEIEQIKEEEREIDLLDIDMPELTLAPGPTELAMPAPEITAEDPLQNDAMKPAALDTSALAVQPMQEENVQVPEPAPINANEVVANITAQDQQLEDAEGFTENDLRQTARESNAELPADTRSLSDLMGLSQLGQSSGVARLGTDVLFGFAESKLRNSARVTMLQLAALILKNPDTYFIIEGHTDSIGSADYNDLLSLQRAAAVREWLRGNNVPIDRVYIRACGSRNLIAPASGTKAQQAVNRRVEIHMRSQTEKLPSGCVDASYKVNLDIPVRVQLINGTRAPNPGQSINKAYTRQPAASKAKSK